LWNDSFKSIEESTFEPEAGEAMRAFVRVLLRLITARTDAGTREPYSKAEWLAFKQPDRESCYASKTQQDAATNMLKKILEDKDGEERLWSMIEVESVSVRELKKLVAEPARKIFFALLEHAPSCAEVHQHWISAFCKSLALLVDELLANEKYREQKREALKQFDKSLQRLCQRHMPIAYEEATILNLILGVDPEMENLALETLGKIVEDDSSGPKLRKAMVHQVAERATKKIYRFLNKQQTGVVDPKHVSALVRVLQRFSERSGDKKTESAVKAFTEGMSRAVTRSKYTEDEFVQEVQFADSFSSIEQGALGLHLVLAILENASAEEGLALKFEEELDG